MAGVNRDLETGVVFSSGFFGFFAHAGFLAALREKNIKPLGYSGSSSGAIVAAMAATGMSDDDIKKVLFRLRKKDFWDPDNLNEFAVSALSLFRGYRGYLKGEGFVKLLDQLPLNRIEECRTALLISATNLTRQREELFSTGDLKKAIWASGAVPMLFKPVEIDGSLYVDGGVVNKAPVRALADWIKPKRLIVHFISSDNIAEPENSFLRKRMTPWHIHHLSINISRQEAYRNQCQMMRERGIEIVEVKTSASRVGPNHLDRGPQVYEKAKETSLEILADLIN